MSPRLIVTAFAALALLSLTGCVAAIPLAMQLATSAGSAQQLCSVAKIPGQTATLCDRFFTSASPTPVTAPVVPVRAVPR